MAQEANGLLTDAEHEAIDLSRQLMSALSAIIGTEGDVRLADLREAIFHVHALQNMVLSQAAARAYPERYRLLGGGS